MRAAIVLLIILLLPAGTAFGSIVHSPLWGIDSIVVQVFVDKRDTVPLMIDQRKLRASATSILQDAMTRHAVNGVQIVDQAEADLLARTTLTLRIHVFIRPEFGKEDKSDPPLLVALLEPLRYGARELELGRPLPPDVVTLSSDGADVEERVEEILSREFDLVAGAINHPVDVPPAPAVGLPSSPK